MKPIQLIACALALGCMAPAWAINKCTSADGKVSFQDAPCAGQGEKIEVRPALSGAVPAQPSPSAVKEGVFGDTWQRKTYLTTQGVPQARAALARHQQECDEQQRDIEQRRQLPRRLAAGSMFAQSAEAEANAARTACQARSEELRKQLESLESELRTLQSQD